MPKSKRAKACDISQKVKRIVGERDNYKCVICGSPGVPNMHYRPRSQGGLGIEENVCCGCDYCHKRYDNGYHKDINLREFLGAKIKAHLDKHYPDFPEEDRYYKKYDY